MVTLGMPGNTYWRRMRWRAVIGLVEVVVPASTPAAELEEEVLEDRTMPEVVGIVEGG